MSLAFLDGLNPFCVKAYREEKLGLTLEGYVRVGILTSCCVLGIVCLQQSTDETLPNFSEPPRIVPFSFGTPVVDEGAFSQLMCVVSHGDEPIAITWSLKGDVVSSDPTLSTTMVGSRTSLLILSSVSYRHSGEYTCRATNNAGTTAYSTKLRVNGDYRTVVRLQYTHGRTV